MPAVLQRLEQRVECARRQQEHGAPSIMEPGISVGGKILLPGSRDVHAAVRGRINLMTFIEVLAGNAPDMQAFATGTRLPVFTISIAFAKIFCNCRPSGTGVRKTNKYVRRRSAFWIWFFNVNNVFRFHHFLREFPWTETHAYKAVAADIFFFLFLFADIRKFNLKR